MADSTVEFHFATSASKSDLAQRYKVDVKTFISWLRSAGHDTFGHRKVLQPREVASIIQVLGPPEQKYRLEVLTA